MNTLTIPTIERAESGSLVVTSLTVAEGTGIEHRAVLQTLTKYAEDFEAFGASAFEMRSQDRGGHPVRIALLNEQQASLLMTYQRNTEQVRAFKVALIKAFYEMAAPLHRPARELSFEEKMIEVMGTLTARVEAQHRELAAAVPKAESFDTFLSASGDLSVRDAAQALNRDHGIQIGQTRLFTWLRDNKWLDKKSIPYQLRIDQGLLKSKLRTYEIVRTNGDVQLATPQVRITPKGLHRLRLELGDGTEQLPLGLVGSVTP